MLFVTITESCKSAKRYTCTVGPSLSIHGRPAWHPESTIVLVSLKWRCSHPFHGTRIHWWLQYLYSGSGISSKDGFRGDVNKVSWERPQGYLVYRLTNLEVKAIQLKLELVQAVQQLRDLGGFIYCRSIGEWRRKMWVKMKLSITATKDD